MADEFKKMTFSEHFDELRRRLLRCFYGVIAAFVVCYFFKLEIGELIQKPYFNLREMDEYKGLGLLQCIRPTEGFIFYIKASFFAAVLVNTPILLYQMWKFIGAGLYDKERKKVMRILPFSTALFMTGMAFGYFVLFPLGLNFLISCCEDQLQSAITISAYFSLFTLLILIMGFIFQTPLVMVVVTRIGLITPEFFAKNRKFFILGAFVMSALFTPPDWVTQCLLAGPLLVLFELGIILSKGMKKKQAEADEADKKG